MHRPVVERQEGTVIVATGAILAAIGVLMGAFGAHALRNSLSEAELATWHTASSYQMFHAIALVVVGRMLSRHSSRLLQASSWLFATGILLFSGSLYALTVTGLSPLGIVTPFGGAALVLGWVCLAVGVFRTGRA